MQQPIKSNIKQMRKRILYIKASRHIQWLEIGFQLLLWQWGSQLTYLNEFLLVFHTHLRVGLENTGYILNHSDSIFIFIKQNHLLIELLWGQLMFTFSFKESEKGVKWDPFAFIVIEAGFEHVGLIVLVYEVHTNGVEVQIELIEGQCVFIVLVEGLEDCFELTLEVFVNKTLFEFHYTREFSFIILNAIKWTLTNSLTTLSKSTQSTKTAKSSKEVTIILSMYILWMSNVVSRVQATSKVNRLAIELDVNTEIY